jgi:hypothetical protein
MLSREVINVTIPANAQTVQDAAGRELVDVHIATPYGVTHHLLIPVVTPTPAAGPTGLVWSPNSNFTAEVAFDKTVTDKVTAVAPAAGSPASLTLIDYNERATFFAPGNQVTVTLDVTRITETAVLPPAKINLALNADLRKVSLDPATLLTLIPTGDLAGKGKLVSIQLKGKVTGPGNPDGYVIDNTLDIKCVPKK